MISIGEYLEWKWALKGRVSFVRRLKQKIARKPSASPVIRRRPTEFFSVGELRRLMGDVGLRRFLKDRGNIRK